MGSFVKGFIVSVVSAKDAQGKQKMMVSLRLRVSPGRSDAPEVELDELLFQPDDADQVSTDLATQAHQAKSMQQSIP